MLQALAEKRIGRRDQANAWIWRMAEYTREVHEEYAVQRWPETKRLLGLLVNSSGGAHARNARRLVHAARKQDRRLSAALLAAAIGAHARGRGGRCAARARAWRASRARWPASCCATSPRAAAAVAAGARTRTRRRPRPRRRRGPRPTARLRPTLLPATTMALADENGASDAAEEIERAAAELNGARSAEDEVADLFAEQQELGEGDLEGYSVDE